MMKFVFHSSRNTVFSFTDWLYPKAPLFLFRSLLTIFCFVSVFFFFFGFFERSESLPAYFAQPSWIPSNLSSTPSFTHPNPTAAGHLGNAAAYRMEQVTGSQEAESCKALDLFLPSQKLFLALSLLLQPCFLPSFKAFSSLASP